MPKVIYIPDLQDDSAELMKALMAKLYNIVTGKDQNLKTTRNTYVTWLMPGIPLNPKNFEYCYRGTGTQALLHEAFTFSKIFDMNPGIPETGDDNVKFVNTGDMLQKGNMGSGDSISSVWEDILRFSEVVDIGLSDAVKAKIKKYMDLISVTKEEENIVTGEKETKTYAGPLKIAYLKYMREYNAAADAYMSLLVDAECAEGDDPESKRRVYEWQHKSKFLRNEMDAAYMDWVMEGYKNQYEEIEAFIDHATQSSMVLYKQDLKKKTDASNKPSIMDNNESFYYTTLLPGDFAESDAGWTKFSYDNHDFESHYNYSYTHWSARAALGLFGVFGLFLGAAGGASSTKIEQSSNQKVSDFKASFKVAQIPICRPWLAPGFFASRSWKMSNNHISTVISEGSLNEPGRLVSYPTSAIFIKDVNFESNDFDAISKFTYDKLQAGGALGVGWGPFCLAAKGSYTKITNGDDFQSSTHHGKIEIQGMQLIGFINSIVPKCPNPDPKFTPDQFTLG